MFLMKNKKIFVVGYEENGEIVPTDDFRIFDSEAEAMHICENKNRSASHDYGVYEIMNLEMVKRPTWVGGVRDNTSCSKDY